MQEKLENVYAIKKRKIRSWLELDLGKDFYCQRNFAKLKPAHRGDHVKTSERREKTDGVISKSKNSSLFSSGELQLFFSRPILFYYGAQLFTK